MAAMNTHGSTRWVEAEGTVPASKNNAVRKPDAYVPGGSARRLLFLFRLLSPAMIAAHGLVGWMMIARINHVAWLKVDDVTDLPSPTAQPKGDGAPEAKVAKSGL